MSEKRFTYLTGAMGVLFYDGDEMIPYPKVCEILNKVDEQQATIDILLEELVNAQQQGYVVNFLHKNEHCSLIPKELEDE